jgi:leucyl-tRNA synthetase/very-short-patch-repair endonuclease
MEYNFRETEQKWQKYWAEKKTFRAENNADKPKYYVLDMFPYPSGAGLHVGHPLGYIASDIIARFKRLKGFNVLHPMGYDSFGLPAEQYAIQTGQHPAITTENNIARYREQLDKIGFSFDWEREVRTSDPKYYKWTQWIFIKLFHSWYNPKTDKAESIENLISIFEKRGCNFTDEPLTGNIEHDLQPFSADEWKAMNEKEKQNVLMHFRLAYLSEAMVNWCPQLGTVLANEEVKDGVSERGGYPVERKLMPQWSLRITAYAERLLNDLEEIDWSESLKESQRNWIGKSEGSSLKFKVQSSEFDIEVFTTRPDTVFGVTFITLAPEHELIGKITTAEKKNEVDEYVTAAKNRSERERMAEVKNVSGVFTGAYAVHPFSGKQIPVWIGDYVLAGYGTGAVMGVPAHDTRDFAFAKHFNLEIIKVIEPNNSLPTGEGRGGADAAECFDTYDGICINSDFINGMQVKDAIKKIISEIEKHGLGKGKTNYRLRDANFGRQRYWGEPIPIYYKDGIPHTMPESELPLVLPEVDKYLPTEDGEPPLARAKNWTYTPHPNPPRGGGSNEPSRFKKREEGSVPEHQTADKNFYSEIKNSSRENRKNPTEAEETLWKFLKNEQTGYKIRRQHVINIYIADFVCLEKKVVIEVDGKYHDEQIDYDNARTEMLKVKGFSVIRFTNEEVIANPEKVQLQIKKYLDEAVADRAADSLPLGEGRGGAESYPLETTTMPGWAGSSWYYLRYMDPHNEKEFASREAISYWKDVDLYIGGSEHATGHLLYVRFWTKFLNDHGYIPITEPAKKLINQGMIQGVSSFLYRINYTFGSLNTGKYGTLEEVELIEKLDESSPFIYVTKSYYDNYKSGSLKPEKLIQDINEILKSKRILIPDGLCISFIRQDNFIDSLHTDINNVNNNELDVPNFKLKVRDKDAEFIYEESGKYICGSEVEKMSKSKLNIISPDDIVNDYGADCLRLYEMFLGPLEQSKPWNTNGISGVSNFIRKLWRLYHDNGVFKVSDESPTKAELKTLHKTIKKVTDDIERYSFNTSVSNFMICVNELTELKCNKGEILEPLAILISPYAPHIAEELWEKLGHNESISFAKFPEFKEEYLVEDSFDYPVSINGKTRFKIPLSLQLTKEQIEKEVLSADELKKYLDGNSPKKIIVVPGRIVNVVI